MIILLMLILLLFIVVLSNASSENTKIFGSQSSKLLITTMGFCKVEKLDYYHGSTFFQLLVSILNNNKADAMNSSIQKLCHTCKFLGSVKRHHDTTAHMVL